MEGGDRGCGPVYELYAAARSRDVESLASAWIDSRPVVAERDSELAGQLDDALAAGDVETVAAGVADLCFVGQESPEVDGRVATAIGAILFAFGYLASFVLFFRARSPETVVRRLRWAYRTVGVDIRDTESADGIERTIFRCPYRTVGADRYGPRRVCHDVLDRVDDGYVSFLERHRGIDYERPRACTASECCYSEVTRQ